MALTKVKGSIWGSEDNSEVISTNTGADVVLKTALAMTIVYDAEAQAWYQSL